MDLIIIVDNSEQTRKADPADYRWLSIELAIEQLKVGSRLTVVDLSRPNQPLFNQVLDGGFNQKNSLKSKLRQKHLHSLTSTTTNLDDGLRSIINQRTDVMPQSVIILTHQKKTINLPIIVKNILITPNQNQVSLLTEMAQILNQIQGFEVLVGQPISLRKFGSSTFLVNDPRITELKVQYLFRSDQTKMPIVELRDAQNQFVYHFAESENFKLYNVPNPTLGNWEVMFRNVDVVTQVISTRIEDDNNVPRLNFNIHSLAGDSVLLDGAVELFATVIDNDHPLHLDVLYATVRQPDNKRQRIQLTANSSTKRTSFRTSYTPTKIGDYYITIEPSPIYLVLQPRHRLSVIPYRSRFPLLLTLLLVVGVTTTGSIMVVNAIRQGRQDGIDFFMHDNMRAHDANTKVQDKSLLVSEVSTSNMSSNLEQSIKIQESENNEIENEVTEAILPQAYSSSDDELEKELEDLSVSHDDILQLISDSQFQSEDEYSDVKEFGGELGEGNNSISENDEFLDNEKTINLEDFDQEFEDLDLNNLDLGLDDLVQKSPSGSVARESDKVDSTEIEPYEEDNEKNTDSSIQVEVLDDIIEKTLGQ